jgi:hypothetical protein
MLEIQIRRGGIVKQIVVNLLTLLFFGGAELGAASTVEEINAKVEQIDN